jgi:hypothetical protein
MKLGDLVVVIQDHEVSVIAAELETPTMINGSLQIIILKIG